MTETSQKEVIKKQKQKERKIKIKRNKKTLFRMKIKKYLILLPLFSIVMLNLFMFIKIPSLISGKDFFTIVASGDALSIIVSYFINFIIFVCISFSGVFLHNKYNSEIDHFERHRTLS